jgi:hypothetical protein
MYSMMKALHRLMATTFLLLWMIRLPAQNVQKEIKPYKILTSGRQLTIRSSKAIDHVMVWTTNGNRVVEQKSINSNSFTINIPINRSTFFLMIGLTNGKIYTEKIGVRE